MTDYQSRADLQLYLGLAGAATIVNLATSTIAPTVNDDSGDGYVVGTIWLDTVANKSYIAIDVTLTAAIWVELTQADNVVLPGNEYMIPPTGTTNQRPASPVGGEFRYNSTTNLLEFWDELAWHTILQADQLIVNAVKGSSGTINIGDVVYIENFNTGKNAIGVELAKADSASTMPSIGIALEVFTNSSVGHVAVLGCFLDLDTSAYSVGDILYVSATTAGEFTATRPTTPTDLIQSIGVVLRSHASNGIVEIISNRVFDLPNLSEDKIWIGDSNSVGTATNHTIANVTDANISGVTNNELFVWDSAAAEWQNKTPNEAGIVGSLPDANLGGLSIAWEVNTSIAFAPISYTDLGTIEGMTRDFDDTLGESVVRGKTVPADLDPSGNITIEIVGKRASGTSAANVSFDFDYRFIADGESWDGSYTTLASGDMALETTLANLDRLTFSISVSSAVAAANDLAEMKIKRTVAASNNLGDDFITKELNVYYNRA